MYFLHEESQPQSAEQIPHWLFLHWMAWNDRGNPYTWNIFGTTCIFFGNSAWWQPTGICWAKPPLNFLWSKGPRQPQHFTLAGMREVNRDLLGKTPIDFFHGPKGPRQPQHFTLASMREVNRDLLGDIPIDFLVPKMTMATPKLKYISTLGLALLSGDAYCLPAVPTGICSVICPLNVKCFSVEYTTAATPIRTSNSYHQCFDMLPVLEQPAAESTGICWTISPPTSETTFGCTTTAATPGLGWKFHKDHITWPSHALQAPGGQQGTAWSVSSPLISAHLCFMTAATPGLLIVLAVFRPSFFQRIHWNHLKWF